MQQQQHRAQGRFAGMAIGAGLVALGVVIGAAAPWEREASAQDASGSLFKGDLPGLVIPDGGVALVSSNGVYFIVEPSGKADTVRYRDTALRVSPGENLLQRN